MKCVKYLLDIVCCFLFGLGSLLEKVSCFISTPDFFFFFFLFMFHITFLFLCFSSLRQIISGKNEEKKKVYQLRVTGTRKWFYIKIQSNIKQGFFLF